MPLNTLSATTADPLGFIEVSVTPETKNGDSFRRVSRIATLDGGAVVNDAGYSEADRTIDMAWQPVSADSEANIVRLLQTYTRLQVATPGGVYLAVPETYTQGSKESTMRLLVISKLSA